MDFEKSFRKSLKKEKGFTYTFELVPGRSTRLRSFQEILKFIEEAAEDKRLDGLSITENAGGHPALSPDILGREIKSSGLEPILHFSCKDKNRNQIESTLFARDRDGLHTLLVITGDQPRYGFRGKAKPVFDLDAVHLLKMISEMEKGFRLCPEAPGGGVVLPPMPFFKGCVVSPFKRLEAEVMTQYFKLHRKVAAGADFVITQVGFNVRKFDELYKYMQLEKLHVPLLGGVLVMDVRLARIIYKGVVPGVRISKKLLAQIEKESHSPDKGYKAALDRAAKLIAILKGIGYRGVHICGARPFYQDIIFLLEKAQEYFSRWQEFLEEFQDSFPNTFYIFKKDPHTGLNSEELNVSTSCPSRSWFYVLNDLLHEFFFTPSKGLYPWIKKIIPKIIDTPWEEIFTKWEYRIKKLFFDCQECGDCTLAELAYLCPQSQCAKGLLNGPCGGSIDGWCEVYPGKKRCLYVRVYERLKAEGKEHLLKEGFVPPRNWNLHGKSSWINFYLERDHTRFKNNEN